jgi:hypothetical protein
VGIELTEAVDYTAALERATLERATLRGGRLLWQKISVSTTLLRASGKWQIPLRVVTNRSGPQRS